MKRQLQISMLLLMGLVSGMALHAQWANPGTNPWTGGDIQYQAINPDFEFNCTNATGFSGLQFFTNGLSDGYFTYDHGDDALGFTPTSQNINNFIWSVYTDERAVTSTANGFFNIGEIDESHLSFDANEIAAKNSTGGAGRLYLQFWGGNLDLLGGGNTDGDLFVDGSGLFYDNSSNRVGIGTTAPDAALEVRGALTVRGDGAEYIDIIKNNTDDNLGFRFYDDATFEGGIFWRENENALNISNSFSIGGIVVDFDSRNVGIGTLTPAFDFQVIGDVDITGELTSASDARLKKNIQPITNAIATLQGLHPVHYDFRTEEFPEMKLSERHKMGLIAQEVEKILPELVSDAGTVTKADGSTIDVKSVNYVEIVPLLIQSIKELQDQLDQKDKELQMTRAQRNQEMVELKSELASLRDAINEIKHHTSTTKK